MLSASINKTFLSLDFAVVAAAAILKTNYLLWLLFLLLANSNTSQNAYQMHFYINQRWSPTGTWLERSLMVRWVVESILHGVDPLSYFSFQPVLHDWCNKGRGMCYPVCGMVHIKEPLLLIDKSSLCGGSGFPLSLSEWSFTICLTPYNRKKCVECVVK